MVDSTSLSSTTSTTKSQTTTTWVPLLVLFLAPVAISLLIYRLDEFDSAPIPEHGTTYESVSVPNHYDHVLEVSERIGDGLLPGPEDLLYDSESKVIYTSCDDGWIRRVTVTESASEATVNNWVHVGGRPLGLAFGPDKEVIVAESYKGLLKVTKDGEVKLLSDEAEGLKFKLTDGVDVAQNGVIYFTDASYKYNLKEHMFDILEGRPYGRFLSFDPSTKQTQVLVKDLYFANGVALSPNQDFVVFCETVMRRCRKYYIEGEKKGSIDNFVDRLPGYPDNIRYDGEGKFWIALATAKTRSWDLLMRYPAMRKTTAILAKYVNIPHMQRDAGVIAVNLDGEVIALYTDPALAMITGGIKIEDHLYYGSLAAAYITRLNLTNLLSSAV
ncbi:Strictosidine synthase [Thalictrum thalictroides]|uniref:Strictosidine synthase n=1 Tax=Thalictrum thalictroides TaxID=46969 RepID=A0A7J6WKG2_THATH|nr:Strictosidine synthase [Thalictrum thalictroides]